MTRTEGKHPDDSTLVPWLAGKCVLWDVTIADSMTPSYAAILSVSAGLAADQSSARKLAKYCELAISHIFVPIAMEFFGSIFIRLIIIIIIIIIIIGIIIIIIITIIIIKIIIILIIIVIIAIIII